MAHLIIEKVNEVYLKIDTEPHVEHELRDRFTFEVEGAKFMPQYRRRHWNGEIHLFDMRTKRIYVGLLDKIVTFCEQSNYTYEFKAVYLIFIVSFVGTLYLLSCYLLGILKLKNYRAN